MLFVYSGRNVRIEALAMRLTFRDDLLSFTFLSFGFCYESYLRDNSINSLGIISFSYKYIRFQSKRFLSITRLRGWFSPPHRTTRPCVSQRENRLLFVTNRWKEKKKTYCKRAFLQEWKSCGIRLQSLVTHSFPISIYLSS